MFERASISLPFSLFHLFSAIKVIHAYLNCAFLQLHKGIEFIV